MKKFFKIFSIILLIGLTIGGTCYIFYANLVKQQDAYAEINDFLYNADYVELRNNLSTINSSTENKLSIAINTCEMLDEMTDTLNVYMICSFDYDINNNAIIDRLNSAYKYRNILNDNCNEFLIKSNNPLFDKNIAVNEILKSMSHYIASYSDMLKYMNSEIKSKIIENKNSDIKFDMIELYCLTAVDCFNNISGNSGVVNINNVNNITMLNNNLTIENGLIVTKVTHIGKDCSYINNNFIQAFNNIDKTNFASNLYTNIINVVGISESSTSTEKTAFYLKEILGL